MILVIEYIKKESIKPLDNFEKFSIWKGFICDV